MHHPSNCSIWQTLCIPLIGSITNKLRIQAKYLKYLTLVFPWMAPMTLIYLTFPSTYNTASTIKKVSKLLLTGQESRNSVGGSQRHWHHCFDHKRYNWQNQFAAFHYQLYLAHKFLPGELKCIDFCTPCSWAHSPSSNSAPSSCNCLCPSQVNHALASATTTPAPWRPSSGTKRDAGRHLDAPRRRQDG